MKKPSRTKELFDSLNKRTSELAVIDCVAGGEPFYLIHGGKDCVGWTLQAEKVRQLYKMAHPVTFLFCKVMDALEGGTP